MKNKICGAVLLLLSPLALAADAGTVATVNGKPVTQADVERYRAERPGATEEQMVDELVARELIYQDAVKKGLEKDPDVKRELEEMRRRVLMAADVQQMLKQNPVTDKEIKAEYDSVKSKLERHEVRARHILVKDEAEAKKLIAQLNKGAKFDELAKKYSTDPGSAKKGGDLDWFVPDSMVPPFAEAVRKLKKGTYTKTPVQTQFGWHIIQLEDTRDVPAPSLEQLKDRLRGAIQQRRVTEYVEKLKKNAKIEIPKS